MRLPRKILIRIVIYGALILIFGTRAIMTCQSRNEAARAQEEADAKREALLKQHTRTLTMPDGTTREYLELTPQSAAELGFPVPAEATAAKPAKPTSAPAAPADPAEAKSATAAGAEPGARPAADTKVDAKVDAKADAKADTKPAATAGGAPAPAPTD